MVEFYVFYGLTKEQVVAAEQAIVDAGNLPRVGVNAASGESDTDRQRTTRWAIPRQRVTDGTWVFERLPQAEIDQVDPATVAAWVEAFPHVVEPHDPTWFGSE